MKLETYKWKESWNYGKKKDDRRQEWNGCFYFVDDSSCETCLYPDCVATTTQIAKQITMLAKRRREND